jgi:hypothetical protein
VQEHIGALARDQVMAFFQEAANQAVQAGEPVPQIAPDLIESTVAQQVSEIMRDIMPALQANQQQDPLIGIREKELENSQMEIQRKVMNDQMDFQMDREKLQQSYELAQQRQKLQADIAEARNDVNIYRINTQAALSRNK